MTVKEFWDSEERLAIHCNTEKKANKLLNKSIELGNDWIVMQCYLLKNSWHEFKENTCYDNLGFFDDKNYYENVEKTIVIEFDDLEDFKEVRK